MRARNTLIALVLLAGLFGFIYYYEYRGEQQRETAEEAAKSLLTFERDKIQSVEIQHPGGAAVTLKKETDGWSLVSPQLAAQTRADQEKVDSLLSTASFLRIEQTMTGIAESELDGFKLKDPAARLTLKREGQPDLTISLGDKVPVGGSYYAMKPGSADVLVISGGADSILTADAASLRYKKVVGVDLWKVARFSIEKGVQVVTLKHGGGESGGEDWMLERPVSFPADGSKAQGLWYDLQSADAEGFESEQPAAADLERLGLTHPRVTLTVEPKEGAAAVKVAFGSAGTPPVFYARRSDMSAVMRVKQEIVDKLEKAAGAVDDLRDARVAPVDRFKLASITATRAGSTAAIFKDDASKWHWGGESGPEMPDEPVNAVLDALEAAKATGFLDTAGPGGAGEPVLTLTLRQTGQGEGSAGISIRIGPEGTAGGGGAGRKVGSSVTPTIYLVPPAEVQALLDKVAVLKAPEPAAATAPAGAPAPTPTPTGGEPK